MTPTSSIWPSTRTLAPSLAVVPMSGGSHSTAFRTSIPSKTQASSKTPAASEMVLKDPIIVNEPKEDSSEEVTRSLTQSVSPLQPVGNIVIEGHAVKRARTSASVKVRPLPSIDEGKRVMENLSSAPDNGLLNVVEVSVDSILGLHNWDAQQQGI